MASRSTNKLGARQVEAAKGPARLSDGGGLYLSVTEKGAKTWILIFRFDGRQPEMGFGAFPAVSLAGARSAAEAARRLIAAGINPIEERKREQARSKGIPTFGEFSADFVDDIEGAFKNEKHRQQWRNTLTTYCADFAKTPIDQVGTDDIVKALKPIWLTKTETATRVRGRIERVLAAAKAKGLRSGENPALWRGHLDAILPKPKKLRRGHHKALAVAGIPDLMSELKHSKTMSALALRFCILTAARTGEILHADWSQMDLTGNIWTVPADKMKAEKEHRVPLTASALAILETVGKAGRQGLVFPGRKKGRPMSQMTLLKRTKATAGDKITTHGFRSAFRDWAGDETDHAREIAEAALSHQVGDETERAYRRGDALAKRRKLMEDWAEFCLGTKPPTKPRGKGKKD